MKMYFPFLLIWLTMSGSCLLVSCKSNNKATPAATSDKVLARVGSQTLYWADIADMIPKATSPADSVAFLKRYADGWVRKQLLMNQAMAETQGDADDIEKKVAEYREYLVLQAFKEHYVSTNTDTLVNDQEITDYYRTNPENFALQQNIVRAWVVAVPKNTPTLERARNWMQVDNARNRKELQSFAYRFANFYHLDDSTWVTLEELIHNTPFREMEKGRLLKNNRFTETSDQQNVYLLVVKEFRQPSQAAPLAFVKPQIREILIQRRKVKMIQELEKKVYEDGEKRKAFEVMVR